MLIRGNELKKFWEFWKLFRKQEIEYITCPLCEGQGIVDNFRCQRCDGHKMVEKLEYESKTCGNSGYRLED